MNKAKLKSYAPQARKDFIAAVEARAHSLGLSEMGGTLDIAPSERKGDVTLIAGQAWPAKVHGQRQRLIKRMKKDGFAQTVEAVAYTWFNRFAALRYMEIHDYLDHGYRVLSSREGGLPEIIAHATDVAGSLPGLNVEQIGDMKLAGNQDGELYRLLLVAQCNALSKAMPFLFEHIDDESELLLPGNLERTDSVVAKLVESIAEEDWNEVEVIGWLYQFYISEKKDAVIGKVVKSEDIPAATQLFTPNWIVQYLVQNSVGRLWLMANPSSTLKSQWTYYIEPAEQTPEVQAQLDNLIQTRIAENGGSLNPETITVLDPACGSGHILVEAYEVLKAIYLERGYQARAIPRLILEKNLFGLDIDDRAAQMAGFALMMKARADDRRLLDSPIKLNVLSLQESKGLELDEFDSHLKPFGISRASLASLIDTFADAKTFGSLIQIPEALDHGLVTLADGLGKANQSGDVFAQASAQDLLPLIEQATVLAMKFDAVLANPPYMGSNYINAPFKEFLKARFKGHEKDLFAASIVRYRRFVDQPGVLGCVCPFNWMYTTSFAPLRHELLANGALVTLVKPSYTAFFDSAIVSLCAFTFQGHISDCLGRYFDLGYLGSADSQSTKLQDAIAGKTPEMHFERAWSRFKLLPGSPISYSVSNRLLDVFRSNPRLDSECKPCEGLKTGENEKFLRFWWEIDRTRMIDGAMSFEELKRMNAKWIPHHKGGDYRRWYGNHEYVIDWADDGKAIKKHPKSTISNLGYQLREGVTWSYISSSYFGVRYSPYGFTFNNKGPMVFGSNAVALTAYLCSSVGARLMKTINPTLNFSVGNLSSLPYPVDVIENRLAEIDEVGNECIAVSKADWDRYEQSWGFVFPSVIKNISAKRIAASFEKYANELAIVFGRMMELERSNNQIFIDAWGLQEEFSPDVPEDQITLSRADRGKDCQRLISFAIGCMMGRYSLDEDGLIYAQTGNIGFDSTRYKTFPADADGILPITDELWFADDATKRVREFLSAVWGPESLDENIAWLSESLGKNSNEMPEETIRRYLSGSFYKDHLQTYKKRPIYWHFSSGKQGAFQALVYLHRYHEGTLARMRAEYVVPLTGKMLSRIESLEKDRDATSATAARTKIAKQIDSLKKKHVELLAYDEKLRHYADVRIQIDLDDGVKVNYGKFGDLLDNVRAVTGGTEE